MRLYCDYFEEDLVRMFKVKSVKVLSCGDTASGFDGVVVGETDEEQYRACFRHVETTLKAAGTGLYKGRHHGSVLTNMNHWPLFNDVYREFIPNRPCRAVIGTTGLAQPPLAIEIVECVAYKVAAQESFTRMGHGKPRGGVTWPNYS